MPTPTRKPTPVSTPTPSTTSEPTPTATPEPHGIEFTPLRLGEPRPQPTGYAIYHGVHNCEGVWDVYQAVASEDGETLEVERPWAFFDERPGYIHDFGVGPRGQTLAALECSRGTCAGYSGPSEDALLELWVSRDAGGTWEQWGEVPQWVWIETVTEEDIALEQWPDGDGPRVWWFRSGKEVAPPEGHEVEYIAGWFRDAEGAASPLWKLRGNAPSYVTAAGQALSAPAVGGGADDWEWSVPIILPDGVLWSRAGRKGADNLFVVTDWAGAVRGAYASHDAQQPLGIAAHLEGQRFVGEVGVWTCDPSRHTVLVDFETHTVHPLPEPPRHGWLLIPLAVRSLTE